MEFQREMNESCNKPQYKLLDWIREEELYYNYLSLNPNAIELLNKNKNKIYWAYLSENPNAEKLLLENKDKIWMIHLIANPNPFAISLIEKHLELIDFDNLRYSQDGEPLLYDFISLNIDDFYTLSENPNAIEVVQKYAKLFSERAGYNDVFESMISGFCNNPNPAVIPILEQYIENFKYYTWFYLCQNPNAISIIENNLNKINFEGLSANPNAMHILEKYKEEIDWSMLSLNPSPIAIKWLEENEDKVDWDNLSKNPSGIDLLKKNQEKINWEYLSANPAIFEKI